MSDTAGNATLNNLPQELLDAIIDSVPQNLHLKTCALVEKRWVGRCQERLFERFTLSSQGSDRWTKPIAGNRSSLFSYIQTLTLVGVYPPDWRDANFGRYMGWFDGSDDENSGPDNKTEPCRVHTLKLMDCSVDLDGEVISRVLGPLRRTVRTVIMGSVSIPPVMDVRPFFCMFSDLRNVHVPGPQFSSSTPRGEPRLAKDITLPPLDGELKLLFLYHGVEGVLTSISKLKLRFRSITVSPPNGQCDLEINNILVTCGETLKSFNVRRMKLDVQALRPITLRPCTKLEEIRISLRDAKDPGPGTTHLFDSVTSPHLSRIILHFVVPLSSRKIDSSIYSTDWSGVDESLSRLAKRLRTMHESDPSGSWTVSDQRLQVLIEARFLFKPLASDRVDLGAFLSKFREVGDVIFVPQKIRTLNEDDTAMDCGHRQNSELTWG